MTVFAVEPEALKTTIARALGNQVRRINLALGEVTVVVSAADYLESAKTLRDDPACRFELLIDLCGVDYSEYKDGHDGNNGGLGGGR